MKDRKDRLYIMADRIANTINGFTDLSEEEKMFVIKKIDEKVPIALIELFNALNDYIL